MAEYSVGTGSHRLILLCSLALLAVATAVMAGPADKTVSSRILVLRSGRVLTGQVRLVQGGYQVETPTRRVVVPRDLVELEAESLVDAYRKLRSKVPDGSASRHILLAKWCLSFGLNQQALAEFRSAERLDPKDLGTRSMVARLDATVRTRGTVPTVGLATAVMLRDAEPVEALGGLPRNLAATFVQRIQPLLSHGCGNGSCHSAASSRTFRLEPIGRGRSGFGVRTRKNLLATLAQLELDGETTSRLLERSRRPHGDRGGIRRGRWITGDQLKSIEVWVERVVKSRGGGRGALAGSPGPETKTRGPDVSSSGDVRDRVTAQDVFDARSFNRETRRREAIRKRSDAAADAVRGNSGRLRPGG